MVNPGGRVGTEGAKPAQIRPAVSGGYGVLPEASGLWGGKEAVGNAAAVYVLPDDLAAIVDLVTRMIPVTRMIQTADTLKYLYMGGRIGRAQRLVGTLLNIKPLIGMVNGVITPLGQERSRKRAYQAMVGLLEKAVGPGGKIKIAYVHAGARDDVEKLKEMVEVRLTCVESFIAELSPALAVHSGPGTAGLCYFPVDS